MPVLEPRCENCGKRIPEGATLCGSCRYAREREARQAAGGTASGAARGGRVAPPKPPDRPDVDELRERFRRVEEELGEPER